MSTDDDRRPYLDRRQLLSAAAALAAGGGASFATAESRSSAAPPAGPATVLITGANRGIGLEFARQYGERGYRVLATCREPAAAAELAALSARHPGMVVERLDVLDHPGIDALAKKYDGEPIDILLNNAGISGGGENQHFGKLRYDVFPDVMAVNVMGPMKVCESFLAHVQASRMRKMMTVSSGQGSIGKLRAPMLYWYRSSKAAVNMAMSNLALQLKGRGIIVGLVTPGATDTDMMEGLPKKMLRPVDVAVRDMIRNIDAFTLATTGRYVDTSGEVLPW